jgi:hypothetical protein
VNVSVPSFYPVYIERNICMIDRLWRRWRTSKEIINFFIFF